MSLNIKLNSKYAIQGDDKQWILAKFDGKSYRFVGFYDDLAILLTNYIKVCGRNSDCKTLQELMEYMKTIQNSLQQAIPPYKMTIERAVS